MQPETYHHTQERRAQPMAYLTAAMKHRALHNPQSVVGVSFMGNTLVTKQRPSSVADMKLNMRDEMSGMVRTKAGLGDTRRSMKLRSGVIRSKKAKSIMHQRIEYKG